MPRPSIEAIVTNKVRHYIEQAALSDPKRMPLSVLAVAAAIGHDRRVLKKYRLDVIITEAASRQSKNVRQRHNESSEALERRLSTIIVEKNKLSIQVNSLIAQLALIEGNAKRLGLDPEQLYKPLVPPDRRVPRIHGRRSK